MLPEYLPWAMHTLTECINLQKNGFLPSIDLELSAKCSGCSCIYCDSKPEVSRIIEFDEVKLDAILNVLDEAVSHGLKWVYTCGLGEPLEDSKFWDMLHFLRTNNISLSMFSNGVFIKDVYTARELKASGVNIVLKMDTFDERQFDKILGIPNTAQKVYAARDYLLNAGYAQSEHYTDLAFSIVPTLLSVDGIPDVLEFCKKYGIFGSIGELEQAGAVLSNNLGSKLSISSDQVSALKAVADSYYGGYYMRPICPTILTGLHIDNKGNCIVDRITGLNCKWFMLTEPDTHLIGSIDDYSVMELFKKVNSYREEAFEKNQEIIRTSFDVSYTFGGCGGNPTDILKLYKEVASSH
jgi:MoaA/NifB/PqqE/SkfB family radical SAM enzyme